MEAPCDDEEREFVSHYDVAQYERPSVAVDVSLLAVREGRLVAWLIRRRELPLKGRWALPGGFMRTSETLQDAAQRVLAEKSGVRDVFIEQMYCFDALDRDPRTRVLSVAYCALIDYAKLEALREQRSDEVALAELVLDPKGGSAVEVRLEGKSLRLAFDHAQQLGLAVQRLREKLAYAPIGFQLLPAQFTLRALQLIHEAVSGKTLNKDSFRRKMLASGQLEATGEYQESVGHRPAELYRFVCGSAT